MPRITTAQASQTPSAMQPPAIGSYGGAPHSAQGSPSSTAASGYVGVAPAPGMPSAGQYAAPVQPPQPAGGYSISASAPGPYGSYAPPAPVQQAYGAYAAAQPQRVLQEVMPGGGASLLAPGQGMNVTELKRTNPSLYQEQLRKLDGRQYTVAIDESGSMTMRDISMVPGAPKCSRFRAVGEFASVLAATAARHDPDGLTILRFGNTVTPIQNAPAHVVQSLYSGPEPDPHTGTAMVSMLRMYKDAVLGEWRAAIQAKQKPAGQTLVVFTDGAPSFESRRDPKQEIAEIISELAIEICKMGGDDESVAISFIQLGDDPPAGQFLDHLDNDLGRVIAANMKRSGVMVNGKPFAADTFDIVDTKSLEQVKGMTVDDVLIDAMIN